MSVPLYQPFEIQEEAQSEDIKIEVKKPILKVSKKKAK